MRVAVRRFGTWLGTHCLARGGAARRLLRPDSPAPFADGEGWAYRAPYRFDLGLRPPTHMLDLLTDYLHVSPNSMPH